MAEEKKARNTEDDSGDPKKREDVKKEAVDKPASQPGKVYDIPADGAEADLAAVLKELEEQTKESAKHKRRHAKKKHTKPTESSEEVLLVSEDEQAKSIDELKRNNYELSEQLKSVKDKWLRSAAEFENYRKRMQKEWELLKQQTKADVILEVLNTVDDFERAFAVVEKEDEFIQGVRMIYQNLLQTLAKLGIEQMDALNTRFDPNYHMAVAQIEYDDAEPGQVVEVTQKGYLMDGTVLRPARVVIAK